MRDVDRGRHATRIVQVVERAAAAERRLSVRLVVELHGQADDVVTLLGEQRRGDRRVDASAHADDDALSHYARGAATALLCRDLVRVPV